MKIIRTEKLLRRFFGRQYIMALLVLAAILLSPPLAWGVTTISTNISTGGTLSVTGASSFSTASTTGDFWLGNQTADDDDYLYMDASSTEYLLWDDSPGRFELSDDVLLSGNSTTTGYMVVGTTQPQNNMGAGDLLLGGNATSTGDFVIVGGDLNKDNTALRIGGALTLGSTLNVGTTLTVGGTITLENSETIGNATNNNVFIQATTVSIGTTTASTTAGALWVAAPAGTSTTTVQINGNKTGEPGSATPGSCIQMWREGAPYRIYIDTNGTGLKVEAGVCINA